MGYCLFVCFCERIYDQNVDCVDDESILRRIFKLFLFIRIFSCSIRMKYTHLDNAKRSDVGTTITGGTGQSLSIQDILLAARKSNLIAILRRNSPRFEVGYFFSQIIYKYAWPPCSRTKIYAARMSCSSSSYRSIFAARARPQQQTRRPPLLLSIDGTDGRTDGHGTVLWRLPHAAWTA